MGSSEGKENIKVLLIEDNLGDALLIREMLSEAEDILFELDHEDSVSKGIARLAAGAIDVILLDLNLPDSRGMETFGKVLAHSGEIPILALTGLENQQVALELIRNGVQDFLVKGEIDSRILILSIRYALIRSRSKIELQLSEARLRNLIETMTDTVLIVDENGRVKFINSAGESLLNVQADQFIGQRVSFPITLGGGDTEIELVSRHGAPIIAEMKVVETNWEGKSALLASIRDVTERKKLQNALEKTAKELKRSVYQLQTANKTIVDNQKSVLEDERLKVLLQMAGATAHEMNQPLTVLLGNIEYLQSLKDDPEELSDCLKDIEDAGRKIGEIVKNVQSIRKYEEKRYTEGTSIIELDQTINILSVEDSDTDFESLSNALAGIEKINLIRAENLETAKKKILENKFDLLILASMLPDGNSLVMSDYLQKNKFGIPFIVITGQGDGIVASQLISEGASGYIPKNMVTTKNLYQSIGDALEKARLKSEIASIHEKIKKIAVEDKLTGLSNWENFRNILESEIDREKRYGQKLIFGKMNLDHFNHINNEHGYPAGDMVLSEVGCIIKNSFRKTDLACRYEGQEFAVLMPGINMDNAQLVCERLREALESHTFRYDTSEFQVTISIGITQYSGLENQTLEGLIKNADEALSLAKAQGKNRVVSRRMEQ